MEGHLKYCLFDANVIAAYYCPRTTRSQQVVKKSRIVIESVRSGASKHFFYIPNFCIAEVFSVFMKYAYSNWNRHTTPGCIDKRVYRSLRDQFQDDIHNAKLFYHYELSRYHILAVNLVAPIDHYFKLSRKTAGSNPTTPSGTFDQLLIAMGLHLVKLHGVGNVVIVTADDRLARVVGKCREQLKPATKQKLRLPDAAKLTGIQFQPESFPSVLNLKTATKTQLKEVFGEWPMTIKSKYKRPYLAK